MTVVRHPPYSTGLAPSYFLISKTENEAEGAKIQDVGGNSSRVAGRHEHATNKWRPGILRKLVSPLGSLSSLRRWLFWRWCRALMSKVSFSVFYVINPETYWLPLVRCTPFGSHPGLPTARACICFVLLIFFRPIPGQYPEITTLPHVSLHCFSHRL